jgi:hypothetical protein
MFLFAHHKRRIRLVRKVSMKHLIGIGVLIAMALGLRSWLQTSLALDISIHGTYWAVPLRIIAFWCLVGTAFARFLVFAWTSIRRHS